MRALAIDAALVDCRRVELTIEAERRRAHLEARPARRAHLEARARRRAAGGAAAVRRRAGYAFVSFGLHLLATAPSAPPARLSAGPTAG